MFLSKVLERETKFRTVEIVTLFTPRPAIGIDIEM